MRWYATAPKQITGHSRSDTMKKLWKRATREKERTKLERTEGLTPLATNALCIYWEYDTKGIHKIRRYKSYTQI